MLINAKIIKTNFRQNDYVIFSWCPSKTYEGLRLSPYFTFSTKGNDCYLQEGKFYDIDIEEIGHNEKFGGTYKIISVPSLTALDLDALTLEQSREILEDITTPQQTTYLLDAYPDFIKRVLTGQEIDLKKIYNVKDAKFNCYSRLLCERYKYLHILNQLKQYNVDILDAKKLYSVYSNDETITKMFEEHPYRVLIECLNRSFNNADRLLMDIRPNLENTEERCEAMILDVLRRNANDGSSKLDANVLFQVCKEDYNSPQLLPMLKKVATESELIYFNEEELTLADMSLYNGECLIADYVKTKLSEDDRWDIDYTKYTNIDGFQLTETQSLALKNVCEHKVSLLIGNSGSGKTSSVKGIVSLLEDNGKTYTLLSTTGKASRVLAESVGRRASTIHRACLSGTIETDCVIVDEMSMLSIDVGCMLINAIANDNIHIVFVGDSAQAVPVGVGKVFTDMIESNIIPTTMLTEIFRYKSNGSLYVATNVRQGKQFFDNHEMVKVNGNEYNICDNYRFIDTDDIFETVVDEYMKLINKGIKPLNILCLSPMNKGDYGTVRINKAIQAEVNPPRPNEKTLTRKVENTEFTFRIKDIIINTKNDYKAISQDAYLLMKEDTMLTEDDVADTMIMNGQIGIVREINDDGLIAQFDEEMIFFSKKKIYNLLLAYSVSIHKSQGSTIDYSIEIVSEKHSHMLTRNLLYVGTTRCRKSHVDIGNIDEFKKALTIEDNNNRNTWLKQLLIDNN